MNIKKADLIDYAILTTIQRKSKAHWGYSEAQMKAWEDELCIQVTDIEQYSFFKLLLEEQIIAFYSYEKLSTTLVHLENLFVLPSFIGKGLGKLLLLDFFARVQKEGFQMVQLEADPHATAFYERFGFTIIGQKQSTIPNRFLPIMQKSLTQ